MKFQGIKFVMLSVALATFVCAAPITATGETYGNLRDDWTWHVQEWLTHAAMKSPKWQSQRGAVERHIEDVGYLLQSASLAIRTTDYAVADMNMQHAIRMLERGIARGFYRRSDVEPLKIIIKQQLSGNLRPDAGSALQNHNPG